MTNLRIRVLPAILPADGREIELQATATHIQWRYVTDISGEYEWADLVALSALIGPDGPAIELQSDGTNIQYRVVGDVDWIDLIPLADLTGPSGEAGPEGPTGPAGSVDSVVAGTRITVNSADPANPIVNAAYPPRYWEGYQHSNSVGTPNTQIDIAAGSARDSTDALNIVNVAGTLNLATTGANGLDAGSLANNTWYYTFAITTAAGVTAFLASLSPTAPTLPGTYTKFRRIGAFLTNGSAAVLPFVHINDTWYWKTAMRDINTGATVGTSFANVRMSVPWISGIWAIFSASFFSSNFFSFYLMPTFLPSTAENGFVYNYGTANGGAAHTEVMVDSSGYIQYRSSLAGSSLVIDTAGWRDTL